MIFTALRRGIQKLFSKRGGQSSNSDPKHAVLSFSEIVYTPEQEGAGKAWTMEAMARLRSMRESNAGLLWLTAMQKEPALAAQVKKRFEECTPQEAADVLLIGSYQRVRIVVPLKAYEEFVFDAIIKHQWDISEWPERTQWISRMLQHIWFYKPIWEREFVPEAISSTTLSYLESMAKKHTWVRDELFAFRVLHVWGTREINKMLVGEFGNSLPFITAVAGVCLRRLNTRARGTGPWRDRREFPEFWKMQEEELYQHVWAAWPEEMRQMESVLQLHATFEHKELLRDGALAGPMTVEDYAKCVENDIRDDSSDGYSSFLSKYGESVYALMHSKEAMNTPALELPALD